MADGLKRTDSNGNDPSYELRTTRRNSVQFAKVLSKRARDSKSIWQNQSVEKRRISTAKTVSRRPQTSPRITTTVGMVAARIGNHHEEPIPTQEKGIERKLSKGKEGGVQLK